MYMYATTRYVHFLSNEIVLSQNIKRRIMEVTQWTGFVTEVTIYAYM